MTDPERAFLAAIVESPGDDTPRLIFADWLEEHDQSDRAEFIRVQCELAKGPSGLRCEKITSYRNGIIDAELAAGQLPPENGATVEIACLTTFGTSERWMIASGTYYFGSDFRLRDASPISFWGESLRRREQELESVPLSLWREWCYPLLDLGPLGPDVTWVMRRGFVAEATMPCTDWLAHREQLLKTVPLEQVTLTHTRISMPHDRCEDCLTPCRWMSNAQTTIQRPALSAFVSNSKIIRLLRTLSSSPSNSSLI